METVHSAPADPAFEVQATEAAAEGQRGDAVTPARAGTAADASAAAEVAGPASPPADRYVDAELDGLALKLDAHSQNLRAELLMHLADCQRRAEQRQRAAVAAVASGAARELAAKEQELARTAAELERQREILRRTGAALFKAARWRRQHTLGCIAWRAWREQAARQRRIRANMAAAAKHYEEGKLWRGAFLAWRAEATSQLRLRVKAQAAAALQEERARIWGEANASGMQQGKRLAEVEAALAAALEERARLEENMKRAFMRGVCALNLEAMALMKGGGAAQGGQVTSATPADQQPRPSVQGATAEAGCAPAEGQAAAAGAPALAGATEQQLQQQLREQLMEKLLQQGGPRGSATGWAIGAAGLRLPSPLLPAISFAPTGPAAGAFSGNGNGGTARAYSMPAPEQPRPLVSLAPTQPVPPVPQLPPSVPRAAERHSGTGARPGTAVPCSLPSNVPPHIAAASARRATASPARPATAPPRRQQAAGTATAAQQQGQQQQQQQQVSRRSLAGQAREGAGLAKAGPPLVVRGGARTAAGQRS